MEMPYLTFRRYVCLLGGLALGTYVFLTWTFYFARNGLAGFIPIPLLLMVALWICTFRCIHGWMQLSLEHNRREFAQTMARLDAATAQTRTLLEPLRQDEEHDAEEVPDADPEHRAARD